MCDIPPYWGRVIAIHTATPSIAASWSVVHVGDEVKQGGGIWGYGGVSFSPDTGHLYTASGNSFGLFNNLAYGDKVLELDRRLRLLASNDPGVPLTGDHDFGSTPVLMHAAGCPPQFSVLNKNGKLYLYEQGTVASGPVQQVALAGVEIGLSAYWHTFYTWLR